MELCQELKNLRLRAVNESGCELFHSDFTVGQIQIEVRDEWNGVKLIPLSLDTNAPPVSVVAPGDFITLTATAQPEALEQTLSWTLGTMVVPDNSIEMTCTEAGMLGVSLNIDDPQGAWSGRFAFGPLVIYVDVPDCEVGEEPQKTAITHPEDLQDLIEWTTNAIGADHYLVTGSIGYSSASDDYWVTPHVEPPEPPQPPQTIECILSAGGSKVYFDNNKASTPVSISAFVTVSPPSALDNMTWRLAHNVKTLRQRAFASTTKMYQRTTHGAWVKDDDSDETKEIVGPGQIRINGSDEPNELYLTSKPFPHLLHIAEDHKNFLQYRTASSEKWITIAVVEWGWSADVYNNGGIITESGTIEGGMGHGSGEIPITMPDIEYIPETQIPPIN